LSWIDDCIYCRKKNDVEVSKKEFMAELDCEDSGDLDEYVGVKIESKGNALKMTQPVLIQSLQDEFNIPSKTSKHLPAPPGKELLQEGEPLTEEEYKIYRSGVGKLLFLMRYSRPDILNITRELSKWMTDGATIHHDKVLRQAINYILHTKNRGLLLKPQMITKNPRFDYFIIKGRSDSNYATNLDT